MSVPYFTVVATIIATGERFECFTWRGSDTEAAIYRAKREAVRFGMADKLTDYRVEPI